MSQTPCKQSPSPSPVESPSSSPERWVDADEPRTPPTHQHIVCTLPPATDSDICYKNTIPLLPPGSLKKTDLLRVINLIRRRNSSRTSSPSNSNASVSNSPTPPLTDGTPRSIDSPTAPTHVPKIVKPIARIVAQPASQLPAEPNSAPLVVQQIEQPATQLRAGQIAPQIVQQIVQPATQHAGQQLAGPATEAVISQTGEMVAQPVTTQPVITPPVGKNFAGPVAQPIAPQLLQPLVPPPAQQLPQMEKSDKPIDDGGRRPLMTPIYIGPQPYMQRPRPPDYKSPPPPSYASKPPGGNVNMSYAPCSNPSTCGKQCCCNTSQTNSHLHPSDKPVIVNTILKTPQSSGGPIRLNGRHIKPTPMDFTVRKPKPEDSNNLIIPILPAPTRNKTSNNKRNNNRNKPPPKVQAHIYSAYAKLVQMTIKKLKCVPTYALAMAPLPSVRHEANTPFTSVRYLRARIANICSQPRDLIESRLFNAAHIADDWEFDYYHTQQHRPSWLHAQVSHIDQMMARRSVRWMIGRYRWHVPDYVTRGTQMLAQLHLYQQLWSSELRSERRLVYMNVYDASGTVRSKGAEEQKRQWLEPVDVEEWQVEVVALELMRANDKEDAGMRFMTLEEDFSQQVWDDVESSWEPQRKEREVRDGGWQKKPKKKKKKNRNF